ncbi:MAG: alpha/beta hydrolase [Myxococcales bacterium]|nr:alpha/beta hydrolase [Myxococcales bacterium]
MQAQNSGNANATPITEVFDLPSLTLHSLHAPPRGEDAEVVICLHGFPDIPRGWSELLTALSRAGYSGYAPWLRGYAPSSLGGPYDIDRLSDDVLELAQHLSPDRPLSLIGHDWGAVITYAAIAKAPERFRRAVCLAVPHPLAFRASLGLRQLRRSWYMLFFQTRVLPERVVPRDDFAFIERLWEAWSPSFSVPDDYLAELKRCLEESLPAPLGYYRALPKAALAMRDLEARLKQIEVPLLYLHGVQDGCVGWQSMEGQERFFSAEQQSELLGGVGHFLQLENPRAVNARILDWLAKS